MPPERPSVAPAEAALKRRRCVRSPYVRAAALLLAFVLPQAPAQSTRPTTSGAGEIQDELESLLARTPADAQVAVVVQNLDDGTRWFERSPRRPLKPASVMKLFVTAAALIHLGPEFCYTTRLYVHNGELLIVGAGDPGLGDARLADRYGRRPRELLDEWAAHLRARHIGTLQRIVLNDDVFDRQWRHADWPIDQAEAWYQAPVGGLNFNDNCLDANVLLRSGRVELNLWPPLPDGFVRNRLTRGTKHRPQVLREPDSDIFEFRGTVAHAGDFRPISVRRPSVFFGHALKQALVTRDIPVAGGVVRRAFTAAQLPQEALLCTHTTYLPDVLWRCNTFSQNMFAECLLKSLAAYEPSGRRADTPGSWPAGRARLHVVLEGLGLDLAGLALRDGSGLSHQNRVTADQVVQLLTRMDCHPHGKWFRQSLAAAGEEGTLRRYKDPGLLGRLRAKSGTLNGVRALAGYVDRPDDTRLAFAVLINGQTDADLPEQVVRILAGSTAKP
ncbi:MAG: D-alanyl-D-alanine carboxypeptidase/D-alanyl-D-alanine-endopeptidase [Planctomycetes bacterium]|nr:D-alanyl-D-alanine carboxypeptidase/D-alanyl-D-alanine-endopeptidase [Planctomycetota bacterium]